MSYQIGRLRQKVRFDACAIVADKDVLFGMSRMFEVFAEKWFHEIRVWRTREGAETWLTSRSALTNKQSAEAG